MDIRTLALVLAFTDIIQAAVFLLQYLINRTYRGIGWWTLGFTGVALGFVAMLARDIPGFELAAIIAQNVFFISGEIFIYIGSMRFLGKEENRKALIALSAGFTVLFTYFLFVYNDINIRTTVISATVAIISTLNAHGILVNKTRSIRFSANFIIWVLLAHAFYYFFRAVSTVTIAPVNAMFSPTFSQTLLFLVQLTEGILLTFGLIMLVNERLNADMREAKEHFELIFNTGPDAVLLTRMNDGLIINVNDGFYALSGYTREESIGKTSLNLNLYENPNDRQKIVKELAERGYCENFEAVFRLKDDRHIIGSMSAKIFDLEGVPHIISVIRDITRRKEMEDKYQKAAKLESVGILAGGIAHEFNNYLTGIVGNIQLAKDYVQNQDIAQSEEVLSEAERASLRARMLTQQLLTFSKGGAPIRKAMPVAGVVKNAAAFALRESKIRCEYSVPDDLWSAEIDEGQISQVFNNLVANAIQAMPDGGLIQVNAANIPLQEGQLVPLKEGRYIRISVKDNGTGIAETALGRIFEPFFTTRSDATGLGLSVAYSIVKNHGGQIQVESKVGAGSTFHVYLPAFSKTTTEAI